MTYRDPRTILAALSKLETAHDPTVAHPQRQFHRFVVRGDAELRPMDRSHLDQRPIPVMLRDLSRGGVGFVCQQPLKPGSLYRLAFLYQEEMVQQQALIVRHCSRVQDDLYLVGGQFCLDTSMLVLQGIDPAQIRDGDSPERQDQPATFLTPGEVA